ncbi:MAG: protein translocase subunit SecDF, partial [Flavobacteriales bacterium]|nr:protein translocase subunit SecDF [Flavobacteriales bacterium]
MQNRGALWIFTILLALACAYQMSFSFFTSRVEKKARIEAEARADSTMEASPGTVLDRGELVIEYENEYLRTHAEDVIYPVIGKTYRECKESEINLGLDLKGGMAVTLEVSIPELVENLSENSADPAFTAAMTNARARQRSSNADFITLFGEEFAKIPNRPPLSAIFYSPDRQAMFEREGTDADYLAALRREAESALNNTERILRTRIDKFGVAQPSIQKQQFTGRINIELPGVKDKSRVRRVLQSTANLEFYETHENTDIGPILDKVNLPLSALLYPDLATTDTTATDSLATDSLAAAAPDTAATNVDTLAAAADSVDLTDTTDEPIDSIAARAEAEKRAPLASKLMLMVDQRGWMRGPSVGRANVNDTAAVNRLLETEIVRSALPVDAKLAWASKPQSLELTAGGTAQFLDLYALKIPRDGKPKLDGSSITSAMQDFDMKGDVEVRMRMNAEGSQTWRLMTGENVGKCIAIVLDDLVQSAPVVQGEIPGGSSSISMGTGDLNAQIREAEDLANILKAGALPAPARIIDETVVGPSLGEQNIQSGLMSFAVALVLVLLVMILYYARAGWIADIALLANVFFLIGTMASMQATLTLPGIAGIVLTIGMAVDANVLINERVRDELKHGRMLKSAVETAYSNSGALSAIIDSNVTTFVTAVILYFFGSGPIKGFATTLGLGILTSLFTAIFISRLVMTRRLEAGKSISFWRGWNKNLFDGAKVDFMGKRKLFYIISAIVIGVGVASMVTRGFNWGVDFTGGRTYVAEFEQPVDLDAVRTSLAPMQKGEAGREYSMSVKTYGGADRVKVTTNYMIDVPGVATDSIVEARVAQSLGSVGAFEFSGESRKVDPTISDDIKYSAMTSVGLALIFMFIYIGIRFRNWQFGLGAVVSLVHDVLFVLGLYSLLWGVVGFSLEIDEAFIAVILTVVGYSINDTVVVFDRIREYVREHKRESTITVFNKAINSTLSRTLNTGVCTLLVLVIIFFFGGLSIKGFVFGLFFGTLVGTYS